MLMFSRLKYRFISFERFSLFPPKQNQLDWVSLIFMVSLVFFGFRRFSMVFDGFLQFSVVFLSYLGFHWFSLNFVVSLDFFGFPRFFVVFFYSPRFAGYPVCFGFLMFSTIFHGLRSKFWIRCQRQRNVAINCNFSQFGRLTDDM